MTPPKNVSDSSSDSRNVANSEGTRSKNGGHGPAARTLDISRKMKAAESSVTGENAEPVGIEKRTGGGRHEKTPQQVIDAIRKMWGIGATYSQICDMLSVTDPIVAKCTRGLEQGFALKKDDGANVVKDPNSPGPKTVNEAPTASITSTTPSQSDGTKPEPPAKQIRLEDTVSFGPEFTNPLGVDNENNGFDPEKRVKVDPDSQRKWKRIMMFRYSKAFDMDYESIEDFMDNEKTCDSTECEVKP